MSKRHSLESYALFYERVGNDTKTRQNKPTPPDTSYDKACLTEEQLARLSDDLRTPINGSSSKSNPLQS